jgi:hypothetical protein
MFVLHMLLEGNIHRFELLCITTLGINDLLSHVFKIRHVDIVSSQVPRDVFSRYTEKMMLESGNKEL